MRNRKFLAVVLTVAMVLGLVACSKPTSTATLTPEPSKAPSTPTPVPTQALPTDASVDFEDGKMDFVALYMQHAKSDASEISVAEFNGSKALKVVKADPAKFGYLGIDVVSLLGENASKVASVEMILATEYEDKSFNATSGFAYFWTAKKVGDMKKAPWSIYLKNKNPKLVSFAVPTNFTFGADMPIMLVDLEVDNGFDNNHGAAVLYIDNIRFLDASGQLIKPASTEVAFVAPDGFENKKADRSNLAYCDKYVDFAGFACKGGAWGQNGIELTQEVLDALVPRTTLEIAFSSADGSLWTVFPDAAAGWSRVAQDEAYINDSKTVAQIDYEQIVAALGEDKAGWGARLQCEAKTEWEVYSVKVGTKGAEKEFVKSVDFAGFACKGGAWGQDGLEFTQEVLDALVPGTTLEINFTSEDNTMWVVFPDAAAGWSRVAQGAATITDGKAYITYEQIVEVLGEDKAGWGARLQCEAQTAWEVYSVAVGKIVSVSEKEFTKSVDFAGFACKGGAWGQDGFELTQEVLDALVPGTTLEINFTSEDNTMWVVFPDAAAGWSRVAQGAATITDGKAYITYEQIVEALGEDKAGWGARLQCEAQTAWEVYSVAVGQLKDKPVAPRLHKFTDFAGFACKGDAWGQNGIELTQEVLDALVPGSSIVVNFTSEDNTMWLVFPDAAAGWSRVAQGSAIITDGKAYISYEQIAAVLGEDKTGWGARLQCEAQTAWEVYSVAVGQK